jgi:hypothetical protein
MQDSGGLLGAGVVDVVLSEEGSMRYMLLINIDKTAPPLQEAEMEALLREGKTVEVRPIWPR